MLLPQIPWNWNKVVELEVTEASLASGVVMRPILMVYIDTVNKANPYIIYKLSEDIWLDIALKSDSI